MKKNDIKTVQLILCIFILPMVNPSYVKKELDPSELFKTYVLDPIPKSVTDIKVDQTTNRGYSYLFGFNIEKEDLNLIIDSKSLTKVVNDFIYYRGTIITNPSLNNDTGPSYTINVYSRSSGREEPSWFLPEIWERWYNPEVYVYTKSTRPEYRRILIYNNEEGQAYFYTQTLY